MIDIILTTLATIMGILMSGSGLSQILRILKRKSSKDVSFSMLGILVVGVVVWLVYGIHLNNYPLIIANSIGAFMWGLTLVITLKYRK